jgi:hypothetical protein
VTEEGKRGSKEGCRWRERAKSVSEMATYKTEDGTTYRKQHNQQSLSTSTQYHPLTWKTKSAVDSCWMPGLATVPSSHPLYRRSMILWLWTVCGEREAESNPVPNDVRVGFACWSEVQLQTVSLSSTASLKEGAVAGGGEKLAWRRRRAIPVVCSSW